MIRRLLPDARGVAAVEFALLAPAFFAFLFLILEGGRIVWTQQVLQETAFASARCLGVKTTCTMSNVQAWAVSRALKSGVRIAAANVDRSITATCNNRSGMARIVITSPYSSAVGDILPAARSTLNVTACFPNLA